MATGQLGYDAMACEYAGRKGPVHFRQYSLKPYAIVAEQCASTIHGSVPPAHAPLTLPLASAPDPRIPLTRPTSDSPSYTLTSDYSRRYPSSRPLCTPPRLVSAPRLRRSGVRGC